jgi:hypothetical protein
MTGHNQLSGTIEIRELLSTYRHLHHPSTRPPLQARSDLGWIQYLPESRWRGYCLRLDNLPSTTSTTPIDTLRHRQEPPSLDPLLQHSLGRGLEQVQSVQQPDQPHLLLWPPKFLSCRPRRGRAVSRQMESPSTGPGSQ